MMRRRLNGWQRIGIILSVIWFFVGAWLGLSALVKPIYTGYRICQELTGGTYSVDECGKQLGQQLAAAEPQKTLYIALFGLAPIPMAWLLGWGIVALLRWVRRGFHPAS
jgi:hypothetical protein